MQERLYAAMDRPLNTSDMKRAKKVSKPEHSDADDWPMSKRYLAILKKRIADLDNPVRYVIVSPFSKKFCLYYAPADCNFAMNEITPGCLFKRKAEAQAIAKLLERRRSKKIRNHIQVIAVKKTKTGVHILDEVTDPWTPSKTWKPLQRTSRPRA